MSVTLTSPQLKKGDSDISVNKQDAHPCSFSEEEETEEVKVKKGQSAMIMPQDLRKMDNLLKLRKQTEECDVNTIKNAMEKSPISSLTSWSNCNGSILHDDVYTIAATTAAADQTMSKSSFQITSIDGFFNRKRGRPPKNRFVEIYKNTQQRPQAIFTSFKLEKQGLANTATTICNNFLSSHVQSKVETLKVCDSDSIYSMESLPRHQPTNLNTPQCVRLSTANSILATHSGKGLESLQMKSCKEKTTKNVGDDDKSNYLLRNDKSYTLNLSTSSMGDRTISSPIKSADCQDKADKESFESLTNYSGLACKRPKLCRATDSITVIRAAGTFYPENSSTSCIKMRKSRENSSYGNDVIQNLSLKNRTQTEASNGALETSTSATSMATGCSSSTLSESYNVLQLQQQLFAFYQQMALITRVTPTVGHTLRPSLTATSKTLEANEMDNHLINMILSLQKQEVQQNKSKRVDFRFGTKSDVRLHQMNKNPLSLSTKITTKAKNRSQNTRKAFDTFFTPDDRKLSDRQFKFGSNARLPAGYSRFRFNEDCGYEKCVYRQHQSHFHCNRADCQYRFCDKTRFVQHTARHERLDTAMGNDFQQYRASATCTYDHCPYAISAAEDFNCVLTNRKSSHFHCIKCPFVCSDTNKVVAHRRLHSKMEFIQSAGFRRVTTNENCMITNTAIDNQQQISRGNSSPDRTSYLSTNDQGKLQASHCPYALRHVHYHCLACNYSVFSGSQLLAHKHREQQQPPPLEIDNISPESRPNLKATADTRAETSANPYL